MISSMTGYGRGEFANEEYHITVEIRSVNHRYLDFTVKLPKNLVFLEQNVRSVIKDSISRGKVEVFVAFEQSAGRKETFLINEEVVKSYLDSFERISKEYGVTNDVSVSLLANLPDVFTKHDDATNEEELLKNLNEALSIALSDFITSRESEGARLSDDLLNKLKDMEALVAFIEQRSPDIISEYKARLRERIDELMFDSAIDESRIATEVTIFADKICVDEELVRLKSHVEEARKELSGGTEVGRKLDFVAQEMNREANTILSKSTDREIADCGIELKTIIEKIREQIQNIE